MGNFDIFIDAIEMYAIIYLFFYVYMTKYRRIYICVLLIVLKKLNTRSYVLQFETASIFIFTCMVKTKKPIIVIQVFILF